jgi:hypothetical protein
MRTTAKLRRNRTTFEFFVNYPWGISVINGYRKACRHFGYRTLEDPTTVGNDDCRLLISKDMKKLRHAAKVLTETDDDGTESEELFWQKEQWLQSHSEVHWFAHDWKHWDWQQDRGAFEHLGWDCVIVKWSDEPRACYRVTIRKTKRHCSVKWVVPRKLSPAYYSDDAG